MFLFADAAYSAGAVVGRLLMLAIVIAIVVFAVRKLRKV
jgi:hypothetical protein